MQKTFLTLFVSLIYFISFSTNKKNASDREKIILELVVKNLQKNHFNPKLINDDFSKKIFKTFIKSLDENNIFFLQSDINEFKKHELKIDDEILNNNLNFFYLTYQRIVIRMKEAKIIYTDLCKIRNEFNINEKTINYKETYPKNKIDQANKFRLIIKQYVLNKILTHEKEELEKNLNFKIIDFLELDKTFRQNQLEDFTNTQYNIDLLDRQYFFELYLNAIIKEFDQDSEYIKAYHKYEFDWNAKGELVGIGARLENKNGFISFKEIIYGGPAWKSNKIEANDVILKFAENKADPINVIGMKIQDFILIMKGKIGTIIKLTIKKQDGTILTIALIRDDVDLNDSTVKSTIVEKNKKKYAILNIPVFYKDIDENNNRDAAKDAAIEIQNLKKEGVEGLIIDLRNNKSNSLETTFTICSFFIGNNPITQIENADKSIGIMKSQGVEMLWNNPIVVLINEKTAGTSEVFAAAIQDYERGIIIGNSESSGIGTYQKTINFSPGISEESKENLGSLQVTNQIFYRINGNPINKKGVLSDVSMTTKSNNSKNNLGLNKIDPIQFNTFNLIANFNDVIANSKKRIADNEYFKLTHKKDKFNSDFENNTIKTLHYNTLKSEKNKIDSQKEKFKSLENFNNLLEFKSTTDEILLIKKNESLGEKRNQWHKLLPNDIFIDEALNVLTDIKVK